MVRSIIAGAVFLTFLACEPPPDSPIAQAGVFTTVGAPRSWRFERPPPDTIQTVTRRVWYGPGADLLGSLSPDGTEIAYHNWIAGDLEIRNLTTGAVLNLTKNPAPYYPGFGMFPRISRDGRQVAYAWWESGNPWVWQLRVVDREDLEPRTLLGGEVFLAPTDWSPDGDQVAGSRMLPDGTFQIVLVSSGDGSVRVLKQLDWRTPLNIVFSPDGRSIVYDFPTDPENEESGDLYLLPLDGGPETHFIDHPANDLLYGWSPDGGHILFSSDRTGTPAAWLQRVVDGVAEGSPILVKPDLWQASPMGFTRDGRFFYGVMAGSKTVRLANLDPETGEVLGPPAPASAPSMGTTLWPSWSPDGQYLAFLVQPSPVQAPRTLAIRSVDTGVERHLRLPMELNYPQQTLWTPDGRAILIRSQDREGQSGLYRADVLTGETVPLFKKALGGIGSFDVIPGGDAIVYASELETESGQNELRILVRDLGSGAERDIHRVVLEGVGQVSHVALSPDGETVALLHRGERQNESDPDAVRLLPIGGGEPRELLRGSFQKIAWMPDGRSLLIRAYIDPEDPSNPDMHLVRVDVESGDVFEVGLSMDGGGHMALSPDGRRLAYVDGETAMEVWVMEDFLPERQGRGARPEGR
ncbi:MAG: hypothetical protein ABIF09_04965 [Gemmatimonadota bacterium]